MTTLVFRANAARPAAEIIETNDALFVPVIAVKAGNLKGENLPLSELAKSIANWNGIPVSFRHPLKANGTPGLIANAADQIVGTLEDARLVDTAMHAVAVFKKRVSDKIDAIIANIKAGGLYEVSTGYIAKMDGDNHTNIRPDHLAILPDGTGACSWTDGCGLPRHNHGEGDQSPEGTTTMTKEEIQALIDAALESAGEKNTLAFASTNEALEALATQVGDLTATVVANSEGAGGEEEGAGGEEGGEESPEIPAEILALMQAIEDLGGVEGISGALKSIKANSDERRFCLVAEIKANSQNFSDEDLGGMDDEMLGKIATALRPASFVFGAGNRMVNSEATHWEDYEA